MKITITRAFERTRQIADFVPIKAYCEATIELENPVDDVAKVLGQNSLLLDAFVQSEVEKTLITYRPVCISCGGKGDKVLLNKEGVCGQCVNKAQMDARQFKVDNDKNKANQPS